MAIVTFKANAKNLDRGLVVETSSRQFNVIIDEPKELGGTDEGMNPVELLLCALGACQSIVAKVYAKKFGVQLNGFRVELEGDLDPDGFLLKSDDVRKGFQEIRYKMIFDTDAPQEKLEELATFIENTCPVGDSVANPVPIKCTGVEVE